MQITEDSLKGHIAYYLTERRQKGLIEELKSFPDGMKYFINKYKDEILQGDCWTKLPVYNFETGEKKEIIGVILSNSCDISPDNPRKQPANLNFAPIMKLDSFLNLHIEEGDSKEQVDRIANSIRRQEMTTVFYLPPSQDIEHECILLLDRIHTIPLNSFLKNTPTKKFTLSDSGFYLFLFKLSVHFCRFHEEVDREGNPAQEAVPLPAL